MQAQIDAVNAGDVKAGARKKFIAQEAMKMQQQYQHRGYRLDLMLSAFKIEVVKQQNIVAEWVQKFNEFKLNYKEVTNDLAKKIWEVKTAVYNLGDDVDGLFMFFARRIANLAGAKKNI